MLKKLKKLTKWLLSSILYYTGLFSLYKLYLESFNKKNNLIILRLHRTLGNGKKDITGISISKEKFAKLIKFIKDNFDVVSLDEAIKNIRDSVRFDKMTVAVTFDDGYKDNYLYGYPILKAHKVPATIFLTAGRIGKENNFWWDKIELEKGFLSKEDIKLLDWQDVKNMDEGIIDFGSHGLNHFILTDLTDKEAKREIAESKQLLENALKTKVKFFTYPNGDFNPDLRNKVKEAGYEAAFITKDTRNTHDLYALGRKGLNEEIVSDIRGKFSRPLVMFALLKGKNR